MAQSTAAERATVAELWLTRDWLLYQRWTSTPSNNWTAAGIPSADGNLARGAVVEAGRQFVAGLSGKLRDEGLKADYPVVIWRDREGFMKVCGCADPRSWAFIRDDLDAPDRVEPEGAPAATSDAMTYPGDGTTPALPYPSVPPAAVAPGQDGPVQGPSGQVAPRQTAPTGAAPRPAAQPRESGPRKAPEPRRQDDATFF